MLNLKFLFACVLITSNHQVENLSTWSRFKLENIFKNDANMYICEWTEKEYITAVCMHVSMYVIGSVNHILKK